MSSPAQILSKLLHDSANFTLVEGTDLFIGREPDQGNETQVTVYDTGGGTQNDRLAIDEFFTQVRVKAKTYSTGWDLIRSIQRELQSHASVSSILSHKLVGIWVESAPMRLMFDERNFNIFTMNLRVILEPLTTDNRQSMIEEASAAPFEIQGAPVEIGGAPIQI